MSLLSEWIRGLRTHSRLNQAEFAERLGVTQPTVSRWITGSEPERENMVRLRELASELDFPPFDDVRRLHRMEVWGTIGAGAEIFPFDDPTELTGFDDVEAPPGVVRGKALIVRGESMWPRYDDGDLIVIEDGDYGPEDLLGNECYVRLADGRAFLKILARGSKAGVFTLKSHNFRDIEDVIVEKACPVSWTRHRRSLGRRTRK